jgi:hypothetical protein
MAPTTPTFHCTHLRAVRRDCPGRGPPGRSQAQAARGRAGERPGMRAGMRRARARRDAPRPANSRRTGERVRAIGLRGGAPDRIRTCGLRLRRPTLYPAELRARAPHRNTRARRQVARPEGFEPPTYGFEARRSIQTELRARADHRITKQPAHNISGFFAKHRSSTGRPPMRCSWMMRSAFSGVTRRYHVPSGYTTQIGPSLQMRRHRHLVR